MSRAAWAACGIALLLGVSRAGASPAAESVGGGGAWRVELANQAVHVAEISWGAVGAPRAAADLPGRASRALYAQCVGDAPPAITVSVEHRHTPIEAPPVAFPGGAPALVISSHAETKALVASAFAEAGLRAPVIGLWPESVPEDFAALRFAAWIGVGAGEWDALTAPQRDALIGATAAGVTLVIAVGDAEVAADAFAAVSPVRLGEVGRPSPALLGGLPRSSGFRHLVPHGGLVRVAAETAPVLVESRLGLGVVRILAIPLGDLDGGPAGQRALTSDDRALTQALAWVGQTPVAAIGRRGVLSSRVWALIGAFALVALLGRRLGWLAVVAAFGLWGAALAIPPTDRPAAVAGGRALAIPFGDQAVTVGAIDLDFPVGGPQTLADAARVSVEALRPGGVCALHAGDEGVLALTGAPGRRARLTYVAVGPASPPSGGEARFPSYPSGPLADVEVAVGMGQAPVLDAPITTWWARPTLADDEAPLILAAPAKPTEAP